MLASAFEDFPLFTFLLPEKRNRLEKLKVIFEGYVKHGLRYGQVYATSQKYEAVAVLYNYQEINTSYDYSNEIKLAIHFAFFTTLG